MHGTTTAVTTLRRTCLTIAHGVCLLFGLAVPVAAQPDDLFARRTWHIEFQAHGAIETWNYNVSHENMTGIVAGFTYGLGKGTTLIAHAPLYYIDQRGTDAVLLGVTCGVRSGFLRHPNWAGFWEVEVGISKSDAFTPPGGTRFNYVAQGGAGVTRRLSSTTYLLAGLKWMHLSNNSLAGRGRNPDIEAVGPHVAVLTRF
jgi:hypothetical protein